MATAVRLRRQEPFSVPQISDPLFHKEGNLKDMIWLIAGALRRTYPRPLTVGQICTSIQRYQPWRIDRCRGTDKRKSAESNIRWILSSSPAFEHDQGSGYWRMTGRPLIRTSRSLTTRTVHRPPVMSEGERQAYLEWVDRLFAPFERPKFRTPSEYSSFPLPRLRISGAIKNAGR